LYEIAVEIYLPGFMSKIRLFRYWNEVWFIGFWNDFILKKWSSLDKWLTVKNKFWNDAREYC
jgi:hypothetical protein